MLNSVFYKRNTDFSEYSIFYVWVRAYAQSKIWINTRFVTVGKDNVSCRNSECFESIW